MCASAALAVLSTSDASSIPASAGVSYGASQSDLVIYLGDIESGGNRVAIGRPRP